MNETKLYQLENYIDENMLKKINEYVTKKIKWNWKIPGGQLRYHPPRKVNSLGDGAPISNDGSIDDSYGWDKTYYTSSQNSSNISLETNSKKMPKIFCELIPYLRKMFIETYNDVKTTNFTFVIAVCNNYTDREHNISAHTDDNRWYPWECKKGPVLASLSLYPKEKPQTPEEYANFQVRKKKGDKWETIHMPHNSILIMPTNLEHRVTKVKKSVKFRQRINITFRSIYPIIVNPMLNIMAVSNHNRYYRNPSKILCDIKNLSRANDIKKVYDKFLLDNGYPLIKIESSVDKNKDKKKLFHQYKYYEDKYKFQKTKNQSIIVIETVKSVLWWIENIYSIHLFCLKPSKKRYFNIPKHIRKILYDLSKNIDSKNNSVIQKIINYKY
jgi:hypothetical protein